MYTDVYNFSPGILSKPQESPFNQTNDNRTVIWKNVQTFTPHRPLKTRPNDTTVKFVLKNDAYKLSKPIEVFTVPINDKTDSSHHETTGKDRKKHKVQAAYSNEIINSKKNSKKGSKSKFKGGCKRKRKGFMKHKLKKIGKYIVPAVIGFMTFKLILVPVVLKVLALMSVKGVMLGMVSFIMASLLSLKQIVGTHARNDKRSDITFIPINIRKTGFKHRKRSEEYEDYEHKPYHDYYEDELSPYRYHHK